VEVPLRAHETTASRPRRVLMSREGLWVTERCRESLGATVAGGLPSRGATRRPGAQIAGGPTDSRSSTRGERDEQDQDCRGPAAAAGRTLRGGLRHRRDRGRGSGRCRGEHARRRAVDGRAGAGRDHVRGMARAGPRLRDRGRDAHRGALVAGGRRPRVPERARPGARRPVGRPGAAPPSPRTRRVLGHRRRREHRRGRPGPLQPHRRCRVGPDRWGDRRPVGRGRGLVRAGDATQALRLRPS
jgi:hypothetical protein